MKGHGRLVHSDVPAQEVFWPPPIAVNKLLRRSDLSLHLLFSQKTRHPASSLLDEPEVLRQALVDRPMGKTCLLFDLSLRYPPVGGDKGLYGGNNLRRADGFLGIIGPLVPHIGSGFYLRYDPIDLTF